MNQTCMPLLQKEDLHTDIDAGGTSAVVAVKTIVKYGQKSRMFQLILLF